MKRKLTPMQLRALRMAVTRATAKYGLGGIEKVAYKPKPITLPKLPAERKSET